MIGRRRVDALPWVLLAGYIVALLALNATGAVAIGEYALYLVGGVLGPGFLVHRSLRGPQASWVHEVALAMAVGTVCGLYAWAAFSAADLRGALWLWPVASLTVLAVPSTRARVLSRPKGRWRTGPSWGLAGVIALVLSHVNGTFFAINRLPVTDRPIYQDLLWHLGLVAEARRAIPLGTPQVIGAGRLKYHWFADADMASASLMSHVDVPTIVLRLWPVAMIVVIVLLVAVAAQQVTGSQPAGVVAAALVGVSSVVVPGLPLAELQDALRPLSPTQLYVMVHLAAVIVLAVPLLRGHEQRRAGTWALLVATLVVIGGSKPTGLPLLIGGSLTALVIALVLRLRWRSFAALVVLTTAVQVPSMLWVAGGDAGTGTKLLAALTVYPFVVTWSGADWVHRPGFVVGHLVDTPTGVLAVAALLALTLVRQWFCLTPFVNGRLRRDPVSWWLAGMGAASVAVFVVLEHQGHSEFYFTFTALIPTSILAAWWLRTAVEGRRVLATAAAVAGAATAAVSLAWSQTEHAAHLFADARLAHRVFAWYGLVMGVAVLGLLALGFRRWRAGHRDTGPVTTAVLTFAVALICASLPWSAVQQAALPARSTVFADQSAAALWINRHVPERAVLATNDHCIGAESDPCSSLVFWLSGLSGRRVLVEGWSYTPQSAHRAFVHPDLLALNQSLFTAPTRANVTRAKKLGVRWLVATAGQTPVSKDLATSYATVAHRDGAVTVYRLR